MNLIINLIGISLIALIIWWFWLAKRQKPSEIIEHSIDIIVDKGVYTPSAITTTVGDTITLRFLRKDPSPCAAVVLCTELGIGEELPLNQPHSITITPRTPGEFEFTCEMAMYRGQIIVET